ncbi:IS200/IS605 family transposase [Chryseobacterium arthrosphaerae]|uniref:IS200/IS605 family transposase n=1 Tax=Chryseobacterium arthrosphaerae TaxID=651561 RepID=UPI001E49DF07|nr:IS200/IS605 family transposase [Chryseobacterium arthrosphaerae]UEQ76667.1 IS200/IS605 family transposase [Chryseobacterium arthrosphaerae]WES97954.1 IS200/IS605 family transposase [Chryseobacterium arthrosphaerae]
MPQSLVKNYVHIVFSTKYRNDFIDEEIEQELYSYIAVLCRDFECRALQIGGTDNHIHILCRLSQKIPLMKLVQEVKAHSSKWIKTKGKKYENFFWQDGYGAFSVSEKDVQMITNYIKKQRQHHQKQDFKNELIGILEKHKMDYDEKYLWD